MISHKSKSYLIDNIGFRSGMNLFCDHMQAEMRDEELVLDVAYPGLDNSTFYVSNKILRIWKFIRWLISNKYKIKSADYDRVYMNFYGTGVDRLTLWFLPITDIILHELYYLDEIRTNVRIPSRFSKARIFVMNDNLKEFLELRNFRVFRIDHPVIEKPRSKKQHRKGILLPGNIRRSKGYRNLLSQLRFVDVPVTIIGRDRENLIKDLSLIRQFEHINFISDEDFKQALVDFEFVILPYEVVSQSGILDIAIGLGVQCVCSNIKYFDEICKSYPGLLKTYDLYDKKSLVEVLTQNRNDEIKEFMNSRRIYIEENRFKLLWSGWKN